MNRRIAVGLGVLFAAVLVAVASTVFLAGRQERPTAGSGQPATCVIGNFYACLEEEMRTAAMADPVAAVETYRAMAREDIRVREVCHGLFHAIGQGAAASGLAVWDVLLLGSSECNWGYVHGVVEGLLVDESYGGAGGAEALCTPPTDIDGDERYIASVAGNCVHGTGHAFYRATLDPIEAEASCRIAFDDREKVSSCVDGMIMEFGSSQEALQGKFGDICTRIGEDVKLKCYSNIALTWYNQMGRDNVAVIERCAEAETAEIVGACASGAANLFTAMEGFDLGIARICTEIDEILQEGCYRGVAVGGGLGVNSGAITREMLEAYLDTIPNPSWLPGIREELERAEEGFGTSADESL